MVEQYIHGWHTLLNTTGKTKTMGMMQKDQPVGRMKGGVMCAWTWDLGRIEEAACM